VSKTHQPPTSPDASGAVPQSPQDVVTPAARVAAGPAARPPARPRLDRQGDRAARHRHRPGDRSRAAADRGRRPEGTVTPGHPRLRHEDSMSSAPTRHKRDDCGLPRRDAPVRDRGHAGKTHRSCRTGARELFPSADVGAVRKQPEDEIGSHDHRSDGDRRDIRPTRPRQPDENPVGQRPLVVRLGPLRLWRACWRRRCNRGESGSP
jgi:hypothetical protein